jgi:hypothetical protein
VWPFTFGCSNKIVVSLKYHASNVWGILTCEQSFALSIFSEREHSSFTHSLVVVYHRSFMSLSVSSMMRQNSIDVFEVCLHATYVFFRTLLPRGILAFAMALRGSEVIDICGSATLWAVVWSRDGRGMIRVEMTGFLAGSRVGRAVLRPN